MLRVFKSSGRVTSSANDKPTTNNRGRVEQGLTTNDVGEPVYRFTEYGNYGKVRWDVTARLTREELQLLVRQATDFLEGRTQSTLETYAPEASVTTRERVVDVTPEDKQTFELVNR